ncbi:hypothetical protein HMPREF9080_01946 [Cardiobacterium valvarum F0432]|uniref:Uncharacterized protein n=1 Tax=Cardiobacterium valvarum F0432 TaxID=797473 RepID=G9ZGN9_9GAMM|nr:hypothetical protein HMPREF9080_01946 [Cardiobacterium valvarum F0432]
MLSSPVILMMRPGSCARDLQVFVLFQGKHGEKRVQRDKSP